MNKELLNAMLAAGEQYLRHLTIMVTRTARDLPDEEPRSYRANARLKLLDAIEAAVEASKQ